MYGKQAPAPPKSKDLTKIASKRVKARRTMRGKCCP